MICAYCALPIPPGEDCQWRGDFWVHPRCQAEHERQGVYLLPAGNLNVYHYTLPADETARMMRLVQRAVTAEHGRRA